MSKLRLLPLAVVALSLSACGGDGDSSGSGGASGTIVADGSSTVGPFTSAAAERFQNENPDVKVTVGISGTGGGFERFCRGETDLSDASRPIKDEEKKLCEENDIQYTEFLVANDALTVVVNPDNDWTKCLTVGQLRKIWEPGSKVDNWREVDPKFPDQRLTLFGPGTDSGTFDYFTAEIVGEEGKSRSDYQASENDNVLVQGVAGDKGALGYFGFSYLEENQDKLRAVAVDGGNGCVMPSVKSAQSGEYKPLSRPLFVYAKKSSFERREVEKFIEYLIDNERAIAKSARYIPLTDAQVDEARRELRDALDEVKGEGS
jgi:phosphate transport system substrate-binding protein